MAFYEGLVNRTYIAGSTIAQFDFVVGPASDGQIDTAGAGARVDRAAWRAQLVRTALAVGTAGAGRGAAALTPHTGDVVEFPLPREETPC